MHIQVSEISVKVNNWEMEYMIQGKQFLEREDEIQDRKLKRALRRIVYANRIPPRVVINVFPKHRMGGSP